MLYYPKIPDTRGCPGGRCVAFDKIDGTNLHFDYDADFGFHSFGTRRDSFVLSPHGEGLFDDAHPGLDDVLPIFDQTLREPLERLFRDDHHQEARIFAELTGEGSFAGEHVPGAAMRLVLFDVEVDGHLVAPDLFVQTYAHLPIPRVLFRGVFSGQLVEDVRRGVYNTDEGAVIKGKGWMAKVKTDAYQRRLKARHGSRWADFWE